MRPEAVGAAEAFYRCGDLAAGFTRLQCPGCGHEKLLAFTCKGPHFCPARHQRRTRQTGNWIARAVCHAVPHRQFVFTIPHPLRGIFRKRRHLLDLVAETADDWWQPPERALGDRRTLVLDAGPIPARRRRGGGGAKKRIPCSRTETGAPRWDADAGDPGWWVPELALDGGRALVLDGDPLPPGD